MERADELTRLGMEEMVRSMPVAVAVVDAAGRVVHANQRARELIARQLGREMPGHLSASIDIFRPDGRRYERDERPVSRTLATGEAIVDEQLFYVLPDGGRLYVSASCSAVRDEDGTIVAAVVAMAEATHARAREERLAFLDGLLDAHEDAILALDTDWCLTLWSAGAERLYGWTAEEVLGRRPAEVVRMELSDAQRDERLRELAEHGRWRGEAVVHPRVGGPIRVETVAVARRGERGEVTGYLAIQRDVTEHRHADRALREAQSRTEAILESITDAFYALDPDWRITYINARAIEYTSRLAGVAFTREQMLGQAVWELLPGLVGTSLDAHYRRAAARQEATAFEYRYPGADPWFEVLVHPSAQGLSVYFREITERKLAQAEHERRTRRQALLAEIGLRALAGEDLQRLMDDAAGLVAHMLDVELAVIAEALPGRRFAVRAASGPVEAAGDLGADALLGHALLAGKPVVCEDVASDERCAGTPLRARGVSSAAVVVIYGRDEPFGALAVGSRDPRGFSADDLSFLQAVANVVSTATERAGAEHRLEEARETERSRIARELHDDALQGLTHALAVARDDELVQILQGVGRQLRGAIYDLRLEQDRGRSFAAALSELVEVHDALAVDCEVALAIGEDVPGGSLGRHGTEVLRIVGEALTNARRHAAARHVVVRVGGRLVVEVADDGRGFDPEHPPAALSGQGLRGMRERAALLGARLDVRSGTAGTTVRLELDLGQAAAAAAGTTARGPS